MNSESHLLADLKRESAFFRHILFLGLECSNLYDFQIELSTRFSVVMKQLGIEKQELMLFLLERGYIDLFVQSGRTGPTIKWDMIDPGAWVHVLHDEGAWLPRLREEASYEIGITDLGRRVLNELDQAES